MLKILSILVLSMFLFSCEETTNQINIHCSCMVSDAQPVQLWPVDCDTYNEHEPCGMHYKCFCQPFECDDEIKIQFFDDSGDTFILRILGENNETISEISIDEVQPNIHQVSFIPSEYSPDICDRMIKVQVVVDDITEIEYLFTSGLDGWTNQGSGDNWNWSSQNDGSLVVTNLGTVSRTLTKAGLIFDTKPYTIRFRFLVTVAGDNLSFTARGMDLLGIHVEEIILSGITGTGLYEGYLDFTAEQASVIIGLELFANDTSGGNSATFYLLDIVISSVNGDEIIYKSDCLDIKTEHPCTKLISYSNNRVFEGLYFNIGSPDETFYLRIPATFNHERFPEEDEIMKRSSDSITLNATMEAQKLLETDYIPYYMHRKTKLVLKMQNVTIDNQQWVKQEAYEIQEGNKRWPHKMAKVWLNEADFVARNVL